MTTPTIHNEAPGEIRVASQTYHWKMYHRTNHDVICVFEQTGSLNRIKKTRKSVALANPDATLGRVKHGKAY